MMDVFSRGARVFLLFGALSLAPLLANCVCVPPKFSTYNVSCVTSSDCSSGMRCVSGICKYSSSGYCTSGTTRSCYLGGNSACRYGTQTCSSSGYWGVCRATGVGASTEVCDGIDNDCDGQVDETFPELGKSCLVPGGQGPCAKGEYRSCRGGNLVCLATTQARPEGLTYGNCADGIDNDCDGYIDDPDRDGCNKCKSGDKQKCYPFGSGLSDKSIGVGICKVGERICANGTWSSCQGAVTPQKEICGDKLDNDCDGLADNNCSEKCDPIGSSRPCFAGPPTAKGVGICKAGVQVCLETGNWGSCEGQVLPTKEDCKDGKDNDCNGKIDDCGTTTECKAGETRACYTGPANTKGIGTCKAGVQKCEATGKWETVCRGQVLPGREICGDKLDNDCDGKVDDCQITELASASWDKLDAIKLWDTTTGKSLRSFNNGHTDTVYTAQFSTDGQVLYTTGHDKQLIAWDANTGKLLWKKAEHTDAVHSLAVAPNGKWLATGSADSTIRLWDPKSGTSISVLKGHSGAVYALAAGPSGKYLASGSADTLVRLWDTSTTPPKTVQILKGHALEVFALAYHPQGTMIASGSRDTSIILWNPTTGAQIQTLSKHTKSVTALAFSADGKWLAAGSADATISIWDVSSTPAKQMKILSKAGTSAIYALVFHPSKGSLASGTYSGSIIFWDVLTGKELQNYPANQSPISALAYRP